MEYQKITNLLGKTCDKVPRFNTKKWVEVHDQSGKSYNAKKQISFKTPILQSDLCDYSDAYIVVKGDITVEGTNKRKNRDFILKNNVPFTSCLSKINGTLIDNAEDLDVIIPIYNLIEYNKKYKKKQQVVYGIITRMN